MPGIRPLLRIMSAMTEPTARQGEDAVAETENGQKNGQDNGAPVQDPPAQEAVARDPLAEARREATEYRDKLLRTLAEMENLRKRTEREVADARLYGIASFAREVLAVADNMHRALAAIGPELREHVDAKVKALIEGVELTERELMKALEKSGVRKFSPMAEKFDPNVHQAMYELESAEVPPGHVAQVIQAGYMIGERVLRPALVAVAKAPKAQGAANDSQ
jgi:molecular chaperone GrpE